METDNLDVFTQEKLAILILYDEKAGSQVRALVGPESFDPYWKDIVRAANDYIDRYKRPPGEDTLDIIQKLKTIQPKNVVQYDEIFSSIIRTKEQGFNTEFVLNAATWFARGQAVRARVARIIEIGNRKWGETEILEAESLMVGIGQNTALYGAQSTGLCLNDTKDALSFMDIEDTTGIRFPVGIPALDRLGLCPTRKKYLLTNAGSNVGKSWWAVWLGRQALLARANVAHITLEMPEYEVMQRYVQSLCAVSKRDAYTVVRSFTKDKEGRITGITPKKLQRPTLADKGIRERLAGKLEILTKFMPRLYVKEWPSGMLNIRKLRAWLDYMKAAHNYSPDALVIDYPDLFEIDAKNKRNEIERIHTDIRGLAGERNMAVCGFSQINEVKQGKYIRLGRAHEGRSKEHIADMVFTLNQTEAEYELGLMRLFVAKARSDVKNLKILISNALSLGQFVYRSALMREDSYWNVLEQNGGGDSDD